MPESKLERADALLKELDLAPEDRAAILKKQTKVQLVGLPNEHEKRFALQIMPDIKEHMLDPKANVLFYPFSEYKWSRHTLYQYVNRAVAYICKHMDPDGSFQKWRDSVEIGKDYRLGGVFIKAIIDYIPEVKARMMSLDEFEKVRTPQHDKSLAAKNKTAPLDFAQLKAKLFLWMQGARVKDEFTTPPKFVVSDEEYNALVPVFDKSEEFALIRKPGDKGFKVIKIV